MALYHMILHGFVSTVGVSDQHRRTALSHAGISAEYTNWCLQRQTSVNSKDFFGRTPLSHASQLDSGNGSVIEMLLRHGAEPLSRDIAGRIPLWSAVQAESSGNVSHLRHSCKDSSLVVPTDGFGKNAITLSVVSGLTAGTDWVPSYFEELLHFSSNASEGSEILNKPLLLTVKLGRKKIYEKLLEKAFSIGYQVPLQLDCFARSMLEQQRLRVRICSLCCRPIMSNVSFQICIDCGIIVCLTCRRRENHLIQPCDPPHEHHSMLGPRISD